MNTNKKIAIITGASSGIDHKQQPCLAEDGYHVILLSRPEKTLKKVKNEENRINWRNRPRIYC